MAQPKGVVPNSWIPKCTATKRNSNGEPCRANRMKEKQVCRFHGGVTKSGLESASLKHGRYSDCLPKELAKRVEKARTDVNLLELNEEIALVQGLLEDLLSKLETGDLGPITKRIRKAYDDCELAARMGKKAEANLYFERIGILISEAEKEYALLENIKSIVRLKKELVESQSKREIQLEQMIKADDVIILVRALLEELRIVIYSNLEDQDLARDILTEVAGKFARYLDRGNNGRVNPALPEGSIS